MKEGKDKMDSKGKHQNPRTIRKEIQFSDSEFAEVSQKALEAKLYPAVYIREASLGHELKAAMTPEEEALEAFDEDDYGILCIYIEKDDFLKAIEIDAFASFILPLEWEHETIESVIEEARKKEHKMYSDDLEELDAEAFEQLLQNHKIPYTTDIQ